MKCQNMLLIKAWSERKSCKGLFETPDNSNTTSGCPNMMADELELKGNAFERNNLNYSDTLMVSELTVISGEKNWALLWTAQWRY